MRSDLKDQRRTEATERQAYYDGLSTKEKLALCDSRRGESAKERARLQADPVPKNKKKGKKKS